MAGLDPAIFFGGNEKDAPIKSGQGEMGSVGVLDRLIIPRHTSPP